MEPLSALALAGNVAQFTQYAYHLVAGTVDKYKSASSNRADVQTIEDTYNKLFQYSQNIQAWLQTLTPTGPAVSRYATDLADLTVTCKQDCNELRALIDLDRFRVPSGSRAPLWRAFQKTTATPPEPYDLTTLAGGLARIDQIQLCSGLRSF